MMNETVIICDVCDKETNNYCKNVFEQQTEYTETLIYKFLQKILGQVQFQKRFNTTSNVICRNCFIKFNEYDFAILTVNRIEKELIHLIIQNNENVVDVQNNGVEEYTLMPDSDGDDNKKGLFSDEISSIYMTNNKSTESMPPTPPPPPKTEDTEHIDCGASTSMDNTYLAIDTLSDCYDVTISQPVNQSIIKDRKNSRKKKSNPKPSRSLNMNKFKYYAEGKVFETYLNDTDFIVNNREQKTDEQLELFNEINHNKKTNVMGKIPLKCSNKSKTKLKGGGPPYKCTKCECVYEKKRQLLNHLKTEHKERIICDICGQTYKSSSTLRKHLGRHTGTCSFECDVCGKKFTQRGALTRHMPIHTGEHAYQCEQCGKPFIHYSSFRMHRLGHDNVREKKCEICGLELRSTSHLTRHMRVHSGEKPFTCPTCGQKFAQRYNMTTHLKAHQGIHRIKNKSYNCTICNLPFAKQIQLSKHFAAHYDSNSALSSSSSSAAFNESNVKIFKKPLMIDRVSVRNAEIQSPLSLTSATQSKQENTNKLNRRKLGNHLLNIEILPPSSTTKRSTVPRTTNMDTTHQQGNLPFKNTGVSRFVPSSE